LHSGRFLGRSILCATFLATIAFSQPTTKPLSDVPAAPSSWLDVLRDLPVVNWFAPVGGDTPPSVHVETSTLVCGVAPLPVVDDRDALALETGNGPLGAIDLAGLRPAMARALERFRLMVTSVGGSFDLKSAYRPPAYQEHLQQVWFKWMELRSNTDPGCQTLRASVSDEFTRHRLLETQKPVTDSDHTRGLAFDAVVIVPKAARLKKRRVTLDRLSLLAGLRRPDIHRDPVHFKLVAVRGGRHV
jgi:hypothetical protein